MKGLASSLIGTTESLRLLAHMNRVPLHISQTGFQLTSNFQVNFHVNIVKSLKATQFCCC